MHDLDRICFPSLLTPGVTIWRPLDRDRQTVCEVPLFESTTGKHHHVFTIPFCPLQYLHEPLVNWYTGTGRPRGLITFLQTHDHLPLDRMPANWYALQVVRTSANGRVCFAFPLVTDNLSGYVEFRNELGRVFAYPELAQKVRYQENRDLLRVYITPGLEDDALIRYKYFS